jgi:hypothetical protein
MPSRERVAALIALVEEGMLIDALHEFYAEDAQSQDNQDPQLQGRQRLIAQAQHLLRSVRGLRIRAADWRLDGDRTRIRWVYEFTGHDGRRHRQEEIAQQRWRGDRIVDEHIQYDPVQPAAVALQAA